MFQLVDSGDEAVTVYLADEVSAETLALIVQLVARIRRELTDVITDVVPSYCSVTVYYDLLHCTGIEIHTRLDRLLTELGAMVVSDAGNAVKDKARLVELPVYYDDEVAPDLPRLAEFANCSADEVVQLHAAQEYRVYALGFRPGFAFLGQVPAALQMPRRETPRSLVPAGAVAIAGAQTAVYPDSSPGGWNIIGRCPTLLFDRASTPPTVLLQLGDRVRFVPVARAEFIALGGDPDD
ncbi:5-oxoprolinase subunit PxpB [Microbulbifer sp. TYP-18]|uniref:5-oxoprolinase subunit PxpB n=1 Tax=Microbulbifer sp. TYP-18 TaxID=3230024 RepID=UPI0034C6B047